MENCNKPRKDLSSMHSTDSELIIRMADTEAEIMAAQRLRYRVFVEEMGASTSQENHADRLERDAFDDRFKHLLLIDPTITDPMDRVVGVYRLLDSDTAAALGGYYGETEYDLTPIKTSGRKALELGRSCIAQDYRGGSGVHLLWAGLAQYVLQNGIQVLFGTASFHGRNPADYAQALSLLHASYLAPPDLRVRTLPDHFVAMDMIPPDQIDRPLATKQMPSLIKAYLRLGGFVGDGAYVDHTFNTTDVCIVLDIDRMSEKQRAMYEKAAG